MIRYIHTKNNEERGFYFMERKSEESERKAKELTELYYRNIGFYPWDTNTNRTITEYTLQYLIESRIPIEDIFKVMQESSESLLTPNNLPDWLWEDSLIERNRYYTSRILQLESERTKLKKMPNGARVLVTAPDFWIEVIPRFTLDQLINYYYTSLPEASSLNTEKQDQGIFKYLVDRYKKISDKTPYVTALDLIICGIDMASEKHIYLSDPFELTKVIDEMIPQTIQKNKIGFETGNCKIIWRSHNLVPEHKTIGNEYDKRRDPGCNS